MSARAVAVAITALAAVGVAIGFLLTHERVEIESSEPANGEARLNPLLAAERLLADLGYNVTSEIEFVPSYALPGLFDTAFVAFNYHGLQPEDLVVLLDWVARGGHLIIEIQPKYGRAYDPIFTPLDIDVTVPSYDFDVLAEIPGHDEGDDEPADAAVGPPPFEHFFDRDYWGDMTLDNKRHIEFGPNETIWTVADENGVFAGQIAYENGLMTVVSDLGFATNGYIGRQDHAYILTRLVGAPSESGKVWLYYGRRFPSVWSLLWEHAGFLIKAGALVLLLVLWRASGRFGPDISTPPVARKAFLEHVSANGRFLWRRHRQSVLVGKTQRAFLRDFERRHPAGRHAGGEERRRLIAEVCDMPREKVDNALRTLRGRSHHEFTETMQSLRALWTRI